MRIYNPGYRSPTFLNIQQHLKELAESHEHHERLTRILGPQALLAERVKEALGSNAPSDEFRLTLLAGEVQHMMLTQQKPIGDWQASVVDRAYAEVLARHALVKRVESAIEKATTVKRYYLPPVKHRVAVGIRIRNKLSRKSLKTVLLMGKEKAGESLELRVASVLAYVLPMEYAEEWIGDLHEAGKKLSDEGYPRWVRTAITLGRVLLLIWSLVRIKMDLLVGKRCQRTE